MKTLTLIRHAKSDWGYEGLRDIDRPLNQRGYQDAYIASEWLKVRYPAPQLMATSPAVRNLSTALIFARAMDYPQGKLVIDPAIYECPHKTLLGIISQLADTLNDVALFAHNAAITHVCNTLSGDLFFDNIPTCGIVRLQFDTDSWQLAAAMKGKVAAHRFPKNFRQDNF